MLSRVCVCAHAVTGALGLRPSTAGSAKARPPIVQLQGAMNSVCDEYEDSVGASHRNRDGRHVVLERRHRTAALPVVFCSECATEWSACTFTRSTPCCRRGRAALQDTYPRTSRAAHVLGMLHTACAWNKLPHIEAKAEAATPLSSLRTAS